jgi:hypothetical protein
MPHCQNFKQKIEELKGKAQNIDALLSEYVKTGDKKTEKEIEGILKEIEEFKQEFKTKATQLIEEFIQRRENKNEKVEIIFDERDGRFIIDGDLDFSSRIHLDDFPNLIKEITGYLDAENTQTINLPNLKEVGECFWVQNAQTINLPNLEKIGRFFDADNAQTINLPNLEKIGGYFDAQNAQTINLLNLKEVGGYFEAFTIQTINLPNLEKIGESFKIPNAQTINLPNLKEVGGFFWISNAQTINLPNLKEIRGGFDADNAQTINLPNLEKIGGDFDAKNAQTINLPNIKEIRGNIYFKENNSNFDFLIELAREWREKGILKGRIFKKTKEGWYTKIP